jgi:aryl-alcohol dehydrogenase-like predicted oxidoreductase
MAMQNRILGRTGVSVSPLCLGTMMFGPWGNADETDSIRIIHRALDAGINVVDTADVYSAGESERIVGKALSGRRDDVVLATKFFMPMGDEPNHRGGSRRWIMRSVEDSLRRLDADYIDLYQVHRPSQDTDVEETLSADFRVADLTLSSFRAGVRSLARQGICAGRVDCSWTCEG